MMVTGLILTVGVLAGPLDPSFGPQSGSGMYTLSDVYYYLTEGTEGSIQDSFQGPVAGPGSTMMNTKLIYDNVKSKLDRCGAGPGEVLSGATFFSTDTSAWGPQSGTVETLTLSPQTETVAVGFYEQTTLSGVDSDLATGNIKQSVTVFGIAGDSNVSDTSSGDAVAGEIMSGKVAWVDGSEVTGDLATQTLSPANDMVTAGFYAQTTLSTVDADLATGNIKSGETIFGIAGDSNVVDTSSGDAVAGEILATKKAYVDGSEVTGSIATQTLSPANDTVDAGYYAATTLSTVDADLATGNIKDGVYIFGVLGTYIATGLPKTGQSISYTPYDDAYHANPHWGTDDIGNPKGEGSWAAYTADGGRFTNNGDGTITDNATGLMWASDGIGEGCNWGSLKFWAGAIFWAEGLYFAGYTDWRLPNSQELYSIVDCSKFEPSIDTNFFPNTKWKYYWSSTTDPHITDYALRVNFGYGTVSGYHKTSSYSVRAVRGGK